MAVLDQDQLCAYLEKMSKFKKKEDSQYKFFTEEVPMFLMVTVVEK